MIKRRILSPWEEVVGELQHLDTEEGSLLATVGNVAVILPSGLEKELRPHQRSRVGIVRTDDPIRSYRVRILER